MKDASPAISIGLQGHLQDFHLDVAFQVPSKGVTAVFGPSGCGKTSVLRAVAGLAQLKGHVRIGNETWQDTEQRLFLPTYQRRVGYVFQEASLFPHLTVADNLMFGARRSDARPPNRPRQADVIALLGIKHLLPRFPSTLSGGERQRVAIGRALLSAPQLLLMDEPLAALDAAARDEILQYLERLQETFAIPILYVSHDMKEVERLASTLVLMKAGRIIATGPLHALQTDTSLPLVSALGAATTLEAHIIGHDADYQLTRFSVVGGEMTAPGLHGALGDVRRLRVAASDVSLTLSIPSDSTITNTLPARIASIDGVNTQPHANVVLVLGADGTGCRIVARITRKSLDRLGLRAGAHVFAQIKSIALLASGPTSGA